MDSVVRLNLVRGQRIVVLHNAAGVDEALTIDGNILKLGGGQLRLEVQDSRRLGHGDGVRAVLRRLDPKGDLGIAARLCVVGHDEASEPGGICAGRRERREKGEGEKRAVRGEAADLSLSDGLGEKRACYRGIDRDVEAADDQIRLLDDFCGEICGG